MRMTFTLDDDLVGRLKELAKQRGICFEEVTNQVIRRGLDAGDQQVGRDRVFRVEPKACGFKSGVDPHKVNQKYGDLEIENLGPDRVTTLDD